MVTATLNICCAAIAISLAWLSARSSSPGWSTAIGAALHGAVAFTLLYLAALALFVTGKGIL